MKILDNISCSADVKKLDEQELQILCDELRASIIENVSKTGGHLASNLGVVELTVALHRVYDTACDRLVFDVGHQCYAHKMLTGRLGRFGTLRSFGGIAGFPKPSESNDDACISGHASTSISNALGMARARTLLGDDYDVAVLIGDGALTGGLAYEGLSDCGASGEPIVVVLNDNGMSIDSNVGGIAKLISKLRVRPSYMRFKLFYRRVMRRFPGLYKIFHGIKEWVKDLFLPDNMFEDMGFYYIGPIDGHDLGVLVPAIDYARSLNLPVLLHVTTSKGKGYAPAEESPEKYHGVGCFDADNGVGCDCRESFSTVFGETLEKLGEEKERIVAITAAMESGTGLEGFARRFPGRFFDVGIAEGHAVSLAAGMAKQGLKPVFAVYSTFLQRSYDMLIHDVGLGKLPVVFAVDRAGIVGPDGATHNGCFDVAFLRTVPNMRIYSPSNYAELQSYLKAAFEAGGPCAVRYPRGRQGAFIDDTSSYLCAKLSDGRDVTVVSYGILINEALSAIAELRKIGLNASLFKLNVLDAPDTSGIIESVSKTGRIIVAEDCCANGCLGTKVLSDIIEAGVGIENSRLLNLGNGVVPHGETRELWREFGIDSAAIIRAAREMVKPEYEKDANRPACL